MEKYLKPKELDIDTDTPEATRIYLFWEKTIENLISTLPPSTSQEDKLLILTQYLTYKTYPIIEDATTYTQALGLLQAQFNKQKNEIYARYLLTTRRQKTEESIDEYLSVLKQLAKPCQYKQVSAQLNQEHAIRDTFITGLKNNSIRQRILEEIGTLTLKQISDKARAMETAQKNAESYLSPAYAAAACEVTTKEPEVIYQPPYESKSPMLAAAPIRQTCWNCGQEKHQSRDDCPAKDALCYRCGRVGHYAKLCRSTSNYPRNTRGGRGASAGGRGGPSRKHISSMICEDYPVLAATSSSHILKTSMVEVLVEGVTGNGHLDKEKADGLVASGSSHSYMSETYLEKRKLSTTPTLSEVSMASTALSAKITRSVSVNLTISGREYKDMTLMILPGLVTDVILGLDFQQQHEQVTFSHQGHLPPLEVQGSTILGLSTVNTEPPDLFANLTPDCHPVRTRSRRYSKEDRDFICKEVQRLEEEGIIVRSNSPWRAQVVVVKKNNKNRLAIDYSETINQLTQLQGGHKPLKTFKPLKRTFWPKNL